MYAIIYFMKIGFNESATRIDLLSTTDVKKPNYKARRIFAASAFLITAGLLDKTASQENIICTTTLQSHNDMWGAAQEIMTQLRDDGARLSDVRDVVDPLVEKYGSTFAQSGIEVCAIQNTGLIGHFEKPDIQVQG